MASWEPVDIDRDGIGDEDVEWDEDVMNGLEVRYEKLRQFNIKYNKRHDKATREETLVSINETRHDFEEMIANQIYDKLTIYLNDTRKRFGIHKGRPIEPIRNYDNFKLADDGKLTYEYKRTVIDLGNFNERMKPPLEICKLGVTKLRLMGFGNITDEDVQPHRPKYKKVRDKRLRKLDENLDERSKAIESSSTTDAEAIELMEMTSKEIDTTVKDVEQDTSFIEPSDRDKLLPLRELEGLEISNLEQ